PEPSPVMRKKRVEPFCQSIHLGHVARKEPRAIGLRRATGAGDIVVKRNEVERDSSIGVAVTFEERKQPIKNLVVGDDRNGAGRCFLGEVHPSRTGTTSATSAASLLP